MMTDERIKELANKWCLHPTDNAWDEVMGFAYDLIAEEREACAAICDKRGEPYSLDSDVAWDCAELIRTRGEK